MCGLSGLLFPSPSNASNIFSMTDLIQHRGPDDEGFFFIEEPTSQPFWCGGSDTPSTVYQSHLAYTPHQTIAQISHIPAMLGLGHRRLSILDLSPAGHQPMCDPSQRYWVVYNGEIYNHLELRAELENLGHSFLTNCDTEVLLAAYAQWGKTCLHRFNGMFAFLLYDRLEKTLFAARDRFGIKPLYYWISPDRSIAFGSEIKQFTALPGWQPRMNPQRVYDFLVWSISDHTEETCFDGVYQLPPGHFIHLNCQHYWRGQTFQPGTDLPTQPWYQLEQKPSDLSFEEATQQVCFLLQDAVKLRLQADVPVGSCLSGGLDSSSIVCLMAQLLQGKGSQKTFTACAKVDRFNERQWAEIVVAQTGVTPHYLYPSLESLWDVLAQLTWHQDEPFGSTSIYAQWCVFQSARQAGVTVMLDGQGSDEQFCGYHDYLFTLLREHLTQGHWRSFWSELSAIQQQHKIPKTKQLKSTIRPLIPQFLQDLLLPFLNRTPSSPHWLNTSTKFICRNPFKQNANIFNTIAALSQHQLCSTNLPMLLHWEDRNSMAHSIEARVPFVDYRLIELVYNLPTSYKIESGETKRILRSAMHGILPPAIQNRQDKLGFVTPEEVWFCEDQPEVFRSAVQKAIENSHGLINTSALSLTQQMISGNVQFSFLPWRFISFAQWIQTFDIGF